MSHCGAGTGTEGGTDRVGEAHTLLKAASEEISRVCGGILKIRSLTEWKKIKKERKGKNVDMRKTFKKNSKEEEMAPWVKSLLCKCEGQSLDL